MHLFPEERGHRRALSVDAADFLVQRFPNQDECVPLCSNSTHSRTAVLLSSSISAHRTMN
jgi:hypothetical protein